MRRQETAGGQLVVSRRRRLLLAVGFRRLRSGSAGLAAEAHRTAVEPNGILVRDRRRLAHA